MSEQVRRKLKVAMQENARLKEEVERLKKYNEEAMAHIAKEERKSRERLDMVQTDVERLTKAGEWQPIETAPFQPSVRIIVDRNDDGEVGIVWSTDLSYYPVEQYPDWWMPLPSAPAKGVQS